MIEFDKIKPTSASTIIVGISSFFCVEFMIFLLSPELFLNLDLPRLICIGIGITIPLLVVNCLIIKFADSRSKKTKDAVSKEEDEKLIWSVASLLTIIILSLISLIGYTFHFSLYTTLWVLFYIELAFVIASILATAPKK